jgi:hypothetical protein
VPYTIVLERGQTYQLRHTNDAPGDLTGTIITADKPIAVFGSHRCANVLSDDLVFCDYIVEQLLPTTMAGTEFVTLSLATRSGGDTLRCLAVQDQTELSVHGGAAVTLNRGEYFQTVAAGGGIIASTKPIFVTQFANSSDFDAVVNADPFMVVVPPRRFFSTNVMVCTAGTNFVSHYVNVVAPLGSSVELDGMPVALNLIPSSGYAGARVPVAPGAHNLEGTQPFGVMVYGFAEYESYGWPGGLFIGELVPPTVTCLISNLTLNLAGTAGGCVRQVPDLRQQVRVTDNCPLPQPVIIVQDPPPGTLVGPGSHPITLSAADAHGNIGSCVITLTIIDPSAPTIQCPSTITTNCTTLTGAPVTFTADARSTCVTNLPVMCVPPSGSLFPPGATQVNCTTTNALGASAMCSFSVVVRCLTITYSPGGTTVLVTWTGGGTLETAENVAGEWRPLSALRSPARLQITGRQAFFRVRY